MKTSSERHDTKSVPIYLIIAVATILALGTIGGIALRPASPKITLSSDSANWPPAPTARPDDAPPE